MTTSIRRILAIVGPTFDDASAAVHATPLAQAGAAEPTLCVPESPAVTRAVALARALGADLWLGRFDAGPHLAWYGSLSSSSTAHVDTLVRNELSARLHRLADGLRVATGLKIEVTEDRRTADAEGILACAERLRIDLIIKDADAGHESPLRRLVLVPLDWELLRESVLPIWLAGPGHPPLPRRIALAVDPVHSEHGAGTLNEALIAAGRSIGAASGAGLSVLSSFEEPAFQPAVDPLGLGMGWECGDLSGQLRAAHRDAFERFLEEHAVAPGDAQLLSGHPGRSLVEAVGRGQYDLLVVGAMRRRGLDRWLLGSTVEHLVSRAPCEILAVPATHAAGSSTVAKALRKTVTAI